MIRFLVFALRLLIGGIFLFSGFTKGVDPYGTLYKFREYLAAINLQLPETVLLTGVIALCIFEFILGLTLALGSFRRSASIVSLLLMVAMTGFTLWVAIADPVGDCGCFGDALLLSNWATFFKNVAITAGVVFLVRFNKEAPCLVTPYLQWLLVMSGGVFILIVAIYGYNVQPLMDFRPFKVGKSVVVESMSSGGDSQGEHDDRITFVYRRGAEILEVGIDDELPDESEGWEFVERKTETPPKPRSSGSSSDVLVLPVEPISDPGDDADEGTLCIPEEGSKGMILILAPETDRLSKTQAWKVEEIYREAKREGINAFMAVAGSDLSINTWMGILAGIPFCKVEDTLLKMVARGNPAAVYVRDGKIMWKSTLKSLPVEDPEGWISGYSRNGRSILTSLLTSLAVCILLLTTVSGLPYFFTLIRRSSIPR